jgi:hypothetical protein
VNSGKAMSDKDPEHSALSRRERVCMNALLGIYLPVLVLAAFSWKEIWWSLPSLAEEWSQSFQAALRGKIPDLIELGPGAGLGLFLASPCLGVAFAIHRVGIRSLIRLRNLWWAAATHAGSYLLFLAVVVREEGEIDSKGIVFAAIISPTLVLAVIGLLGTRARERAEEA